VRMRAALLFGVGDLRLVETAKTSRGPRRGAGRVMACAVCPTDIRKFRTGDNGE
jgi:hypothetical protein